MLVFVSQLFTGFSGGGFVVKNAEYRRARAGHYSAKRTIIEQNALDVGDCGVAAVGNILKDIVHPSHDAAEITPFQGSADAGSVGVTAQLNRIELAEKLGG